VAYLVSTTGSDEEFCSHRQPNRPRVRLFTTTGALGTRVLSQEDCSAMTPVSTTRRGRALATTTAAGLVLGALAATTAGPAQSAEPVADCATPFDHTTLEAGDTVTALSVVSGTEPIEFTGSVLGVLDDGIAPGLDMIMIDFEDADGTPMAKAGGIWQGMSGSPVYVGDPADGDLVGAIAYGLSWGPSPIAGVTPYADMDDYLSAPATRAGKVEVGKRDAARIAATGEATRAQAGRGFSQLDLPVGVSGVDAERLAKATRKARKSDRDYLRGRGLSAGISGRAADAVEEDMVAGGNMAATISYGDVTFSGVGTVTSVCAGEVVGFGHPMLFNGPTALGLSPAEALFVQPDSLGVPFKVANIAPAVGTITQDRLTGISGAFGTAPSGGLISSTVTYGERSRTGESEIYYSPYAADVTFSQLLGNHDRVVDGVVPGSEVASYTVTGLDETGEPFEVAFDDTWTSRYDVSFESIFEIADLVYVLSSFPDVELTSVVADGTVNDNTDRSRVAGLEQKIGGEWVTVRQRRGGISAQKGKVLRLRAVVKDDTDGSLSYATLNTRISKRAARFGYLQVVGGSSTWSNVYRAKSVEDVQEVYSKRVDNTDVVFDMRLRRNGGRLKEGVAPGEAGNVVAGSKYYEIQVF